MTRTSKFSTLMLVWCLIVGACGNPEPTARFVNGCDVPVTLEADEWDGERDPAIFADFADWPDKVLRTLEPGESWDFTRPGAGENYVANVLYRGGHDVYFWSVDPDNHGVITLEGAACPPGS